MDIGQLNDRNYIDVTFPDAPTDFSIDRDTIAAGDTVDVSFTIENTSLSSSATSIAFTDVLADFIPGIVVSNLEAFATRYATGDITILDEQVPFDNNPNDTGTMFEHLRSPLWGARARHVGGQHLEVMRLDPQLDHVAVRPVFRNRARSGSRTERQRR